MYQQIQQLKPILPPVVEASKDLEDVGAELHVEYEIPGGDDTVLEVFKAVTPFIEDQLFPSNQIIVDSAPSPEISSSDATEDIDTNSETKISSETEEFEMSSVETIEDTDGNENNSESEISSESNGNSVKRSSSLVTIYAENCKSVIGMDALASPINENEKEGRVEEKPPSPRLTRSARKSGGSLVNPIKYFDCLLCEKSEYNENRLANHYKKTHKINVDMGQKLPQTHEELKNLINRNNGSQE